MFKRKYPIDNAYLEAYEPSYNWRNAAKGGKQTSFGSEFVSFEPTTPLTADGQPSTIEFEIQGPRPLKVNHQCRFHIGVEFQKKSVDAATKVVTWTALNTVDNPSCLMFAPNWFEKLIQGIDVIVDNNKCVSHVQNVHVGQELSGLFHYYMSDQLKDVLAPEPFNPVRMSPGVDNNDAVMLHTAKPYTDIFPKMIDANFYYFTWIPLNTFPFHQTPNHELDCPQQDIPIHLMGKMYIRIHFKPKQHLVWKPTTATESPDIYRMVFRKFTFVAEENILPHLMNNLGQSSPNMKMPKMLKNYEYPGFIMDSRCDTIKDGDLEYRATFNQASLPEQLLIVCLDRDVMGGHYDFSNKFTLDATSYFKKHNIKSVELRYAGQVFHNKSPNFEELSGVQSTLQTIQALKINGLFGMTVNPKRISYSKVALDFEKTPFPMVLIDYTLLNGTRQRRQPMQTDGTSLKTEEEIQLTIKFNTGGATSSSTYAIYFCYTDKGMMYDAKQNKFINPYKKYL